MPKGHALFPVRLDFFVSTEVRLQVIAISYLMGLGGKHAPATRDMLELGIKQYIEGLSPKKRAEFDFILTRVRISSDPASIHKDTEPV